jgi:hypothetical protein
MFWEAIGPRDDAYEHLFRVPTPPNGQHEFNELWVFSASSYLRSLMDTNTVSIALRMPEAAERLKVLKQLVSIAC